MLRLIAVVEMWSVRSADRPTLALDREALDRRSRTRRSIPFDAGLQAGSVLLALDDEVAGVLLQSIDGTLGSIVSSKSASHSAGSRLLVTIVEARALRSTSS